MTKDNLTDKELKYITYLETRGFVLLNVGEGKFLFHTPRKKLVWFEFYEIENIYNDLKKKEESRGKK